MANSYTKLDQALRDLIEAYAELEEELDEKYGDDEDAFSNAVIEVLETSLEGAIEEQDSSSSFVASMLSSLSESLEQLDPSAFEEGEEDEEYEVEDTDYDIDEEELDLDEDEGEDEDE